MTAFNHNHPHNVDEVRNRNKICNDFCPTGHTVNRRKKPTHQVEYLYEEKSKRLCLLLRFGVGRNQ